MKPFEVIQSTMTRAECKAALETNISALKAIGYSDTAIAAMLNGLHREDALDMTRRYIQDHANRFNCH